MSKFNSILLLTFISAVVGYGQPYLSQGPRKVHQDSISLRAEFLPEFKTDPHSKESEGNQISGVVRTIFQDRDGNFWFGTQNGLCRHDGESLIYFDIRNDLGQAITVKVIAQDETGNIWIGSTDGVTLYDGTYFTTYTENEGLISNDVWCLTTDKNGTVWIGTIEGACTFDGTTFTPFELPEGKADTTMGVTSAKMVHAIIEDGKGNIWFATNGGVCIYDGEVLTHLSEKDGLCNDFVGGIVQDKNGNYWLETAHGGLCHYDGIQFKNVTNNLDATITGVGSLFEDSKRKIWFTVGHSGIYCYDGETFIHYEKENGLMSHRTFQIYEDQQGRIWSVGFGGAFRLDGTNFVNVTRDGPWDSR